MLIPEGGGERKPDFSFPLNSLEASQLFVSRRRWKGNRMCGCKGSPGRACPKRRVALERQQHILQGHQISDPVPSPPVLSSTSHLIPPDLQITTFKTEVNTNTTLLSQMAQ